MTQLLPPYLPHLGDAYYRRGKKIPKGFYRITVKALIMNSVGGVLIFRESRFSDKASRHYRSDGGMYDLPGGGLDWGEDWHGGLMRELHEELGLMPDDVEIAHEPLYIQVSELDDRYAGDMDLDDFYPTVMLYFPVKVSSVDIGGLDHIWIPPDHWGDRRIWSHVASLAQIFRKTDFPKNFITSLS